MENYYQQGGAYYQAPQQSLDQRVSAVMKKVYVKMFLALLVTAAVSVGVALFKTDLALFLATHNWAYWGVAIVELGLVFWISSRLNKLAPAMATGLFYLFAVVNGLSLSIICLAFSFESLFKTFLICAGTFGAMSIYGYFTTRDLSRIGSLLYMALFGLLIAIVVNIFWANSALDWIISGAGVLIFIGLTAWDTQHIKQLAATNPGLAAENIATWGALSLYLDFINLFIYLLRFFGNGRD
ncbi:MAG: Bax inhibitor-1/YccA family protein [Muribaculaceae bacterium]|nr:Bax inhibitor-1/YccA family protein [Muribaculaceae bacterium]